MKRFTFALAAIVAVLAAAATTWAVTKAPPIGSQLGSSVQLGAPKTAVKAPACPAGVAPKDCLIVMTRSTAIEMTTDAVATPMKVHHAGEIVSFTIGLAQLSTNPKTAASYVKNLNSLYGGAPEAQLTILKYANNHKWTVVSEGPLVKLQPYLGYVVQFPLTKPLAVKSGESIALTVPTWAPILSYKLTSSQYSYRQSRNSSCGKPAPTQSAQLTVGQTTQYGCFYPGTRVEYGATELTNPVAPTTTTTTTTKTTTTPKKK
jgi:hypothetical protein